MTTFLMVFPDNRDGPATIQVKLDELIRVSSAHDTFVGIEHLTDDELEDIQRSMCRKETSLPRSRSTAKRPDQSET
jgi:low affinity Fe/Cu permease